MWVPQVKVGFTPILRDTGWFAKTGIELRTENGELL